MDEQLRHDPYTKTQVKELLYRFIYSPLDIHFQQRIESLIQRNCAIQTAQHRSFIYKNEIYNCDAAPLPLKLTRLAAALRPEMDTYLEDKAMVNLHEMPYVMGFITQILNASNNIRDYLDVLPDALHPPLMQLIATCPCRQGVLGHTDILNLKTRNTKANKMIKERLVKNLLI
jgi:hypothetical protein